MAVTPLTDLAHTLWQVGRPCGSALGPRFRWCISNAATPEVGDFEWALVERMRLWRAGTGRRPKSFGSNMVWLESTRRMLSVGIAFRWCISNRIKSQVWPQGPGATNRKRAVELVAPHGFGCKWWGWLLRTGKY